MLDGAVCVLDSNQGVEPQTETVWRQGDKYNVPRIIFSNKMDKTGADFYMCLADIKDKLGARAIPLQLPIGAEADFQGIVDLIRMKSVIWDGDGKDAKMIEGRDPADLMDKALEYRAAMIEAAVEMDDDAMGAYLDGKEPDEETLRKLIRKGHGHARRSTRCCAARRLRTKACRRYWMPSWIICPRPAIASGVQGGIDPKTDGEIDRQPLDSEPLAMIAFKIMSFEHVGSITFCRIYSGQDRAGHGAREHVA